MCVCFFAGEPAGRRDVVTGSSLCEGCPLIQHSIGFRPQGPDAPSPWPVHLRIKTTFQRVIGIDQVRKCDQLNCPLSVWIIVLSENVTSSIVSTVPGLLFPAPGVCRCSPRKQHAISQGSLRASTGITSFFHGGKGRGKMAGVSVRSALPEIPVTQTSPQARSTAPQHSYRF